MNPLVTVVGDAHIEQFRPVKWTAESAYATRSRNGKFARPKDDVSDASLRFMSGSAHSELTAVYRSPEDLEELRTESPGGAAFLSLLLKGSGVPGQAVLPIGPEDSEATELLTSDSEWTFTRAGAPRRPSRIESVYDNTRNTWELKFRMEERHKPPTPTALPTLDRTAVLAIDDHGRGSVTPELVRAALTCRPRTVVLSAEYGHRSDYPLRTITDLIIVCTERQALLWSDVKSLPNRFPPGPPGDHEQLIRLIFSKLAGKFTKARNIIVNLAGPPFVSLLLTRSSKATTRTHAVELIAPVDPPTEGAARVPGVDTFALAAFVRAIAEKRSVADGAKEAVNAAMTYTNASIDEHDRYFGRCETLPVASGELVKTTPFTKVGTTRRFKPPKKTDILRDAELHGRFLPPESDLQDYFAPGRVGKQVKTMLDVLNAYIVKSSRRPFNVLLQADPGSGKSFFATCVARQLEREALKRGGLKDQHPLVEANLSLSPKLEDVERDLADLYETIRDHRAIGKMPVVLLDEFDSLLASRTDGTNEMNQLVAQMLAPLWDGAFSVRGRVHRLGGFVLLIAVSTSDFERALTRVTRKAGDFLSRIDVRLSLRAPLGEDTRKANIGVAVAMLKKHFGPSVERVQLAVLEAIGHATFPRKNRAIDQLFMLSSKPEPHENKVFGVKHLPQGAVCSDLVSGLDLRRASKLYGNTFIEI